MMYDNNRMTTQEMWRRVIMKFNEQHNQKHLSLGGKPEEAQAKAAIAGWAKAISEFNARHRAA